MIITGSWIFSVLVNIPAFLVLKFDIESYSCTFDWPEEWMDTAFQMNWNVLTVLTFLVMAVIYSRVVYTLWVKNNHDNPLTHQQRVRVYFEAIQFLRLCSHLVPEHRQKKAFRLSARAQCPRAILDGHYKCEHKYPRQK